MGTLHGASANFKILADDSVDIQEIPANRSADHIDDRVDRADFVEVHLLCLDAVNRPLSFCQYAEAGNRIGLYLVREFAGFNGFTNIRKSAVVMVVTVIMRMRVAVRIVVVVRVTMRMIVVMVMVMVMVMRVPMVMVM